MSLKGAVVIPARFESSRFPGKPLIEINGKPMIQHVYERCKQADNLIDVSKSIFFFFEPISM